MADTISVVTIMRDILYVAWGTHVESSHDSDLSKPWGWLEAKMNWVQECAVCQEFVNVDHDIDQWEKDH